MLDYKTSPPQKTELKRIFIDDLGQRFGHETLGSVAHMILEIGNTRNLVDIGLNYMVSSLSACRGDAGFLNRTSPFYTPQIIVHNGAYTTPDFAGLDFPNHAHLIQRAWDSQSAVVCGDTQADSSVDDMRDILHSIQCRSVIFKQLRYDNRPLGMLCIDFSRDTHQWLPDEIAWADEFCDTFLAPLSAISSYWQERGSRRPVPKPTPSELQNIRLAADGLTYRQIAERRSKSVRTVENQLKSARAALGASNLVDLIRKCECWL